MIPRVTAMTARRVLPACALWLVSAGCAGSSRPRYDVVLVLQSDLSVPTEADGLQIQIVGGSSAPDPTGRNGNGVGVALSGGFPLSLRVLDDAAQASFSTTVQLLSGLPGTSPATIVVRRTATDIRFPADGTMMLVLPLLRRCACQGTTCPAPGDPDCDNIDHPALQPFDPAVAPPSSFDPLGMISVPPPPVGTH